nr:class I SAM-dependent methyltransferase [Actinomycetota bacterium]
MNKKNDMTDKTPQPAEYDPLADLYDLEYTHDDDISFWLTLANQQTGPIVEWGAGTGRIAIPLANAIHTVTAVEVSSEMVERGREKSTAVEWTVGDMRSARLGRGYGLAICAFNSFLCLLSMKDALAFLRNARKHLRPDGLLGIEVSAFSEEELADESGDSNLHHDFTRYLPGGGWLDRFSISSYDAATRIMSMRLFYELYGTSGISKSRRAHDLEIRATDRAELESVLELAGFVVEYVYGGFEGEAFEPDSD